jgi:aminoglycoside/choline kinase family phosphotransferase
VGWAAAESRPLAGDASFRRYDRLTLGDRRAVLMDAPAPMEDVRPFLAVAKRLAALGLSAPAVIAADIAAGFLLLEDLGDDTYTRVIAAGGDERALYALAIDLLIDLHRRPAAETACGMPAYDDALLLREAALLVDWYLPAMTGHPTGPRLRQDYLDIWTRLFPVARRVPDTLVLRDYHVDNLMWLPQRKGVAACGLLDFQDAVAGPVAYDVVSLLEDARRDLDPALVAAMIQRYRAAMPGIDDQAFDASYAVLGAQRNAKIVGIFARLSARDGKPHYLKHIPRVWRLLEGDLAHPALGPMRDWIDRNIPVALRGIPRPALAEAGL